jgi:hypothetical protein
MSADLQTYIEMQGTLEELKSMLSVIEDYCNPDKDQSLDSFTLWYEDESNSIINPSSFSEEDIHDFLVKSKNKILIEADGPYGIGGVTESGLFEAIASAAPNATFTAVTSGFTTGQSDNFVGELKDGLLHLTYSILLDEDYEDGEEIPLEDWFTEKSIYDPIKKKYV